MPNACLTTLATARSASFYVFLTSNIVGTGPVARRTQLVAVHPVHIWNLQNVKARYSDQKAEKFATNSTSTPCFFKLISICRTHYFPRFQICRHTLAALNLIFGRIKFELRLFLKLPSNITSAIYWRDRFYSTFVNFIFYCILIYLCSKHFLKEYNSHLGTFIILLSVFYVLLTVWGPVYNLQGKIYCRLIWICNSYNLYENVNVEDGSIVLSTSIFLLVVSVVYFICARSSYPW